jgi:hypothetical protein
MNNFSGLEITAVPPDIGFSHAVGGMLGALDSEPFSSLEVAEVALTMC